MSITITINCDNAAFDEQGEGQHLELARILGTLAARLENDGLQEFPLMDINGNKVGRLKVNE